MILAVIQAVYATARSWKGGVRCFVGGGCLDAAMVYEAGAFLLSVGIQHYFQREGQAVLYAVCFTADRYFPEAGKQLDRVMARGFGKCE